MRHILQVFRDSQNIGADKPVFEDNPSSAAGSESVTARAACEVKGSSDGSSANETALFKVSKTNTDRSSGKTYDKDFLQVGDATRIIGVGDDSQLVDVNRANGLGLNGRQNLDTNSDLYLMLAAAWTKAMARGDPLGRDTAGVTTANIFARPPARQNGRRQPPPLRGEPVPNGDQAPLQSDGPESRDIVTLSLPLNRATQIAMQNYDIGCQNRTFIRTRHVDNSDCSNL